jgi:hypothetical protein
MRTPLLSVLFVAVILVSSVFASTNLSISNSGTVSGLLVGQFFDYAVIIMLENHGINTTYGSSCLGNCTYFNHLANTNSLAENYDNAGVSGSLGDYIAITSGDASVSCNNPPDGTCGPYNDVNLVDSIERAHLSWKAYMEDYPGSGSGSGYSSGGCFMGATSTSGHYWAIHNPFIYYQDIVNNTSRCSRIAVANSVIPPTQASCGSKTDPGTVETDNLFLNELSNVASAANYVFLTPNTVDDLHDCSTGDVSIGNHYLQQLVPQILNSALFTQKRAALFVTFDEFDPFVGTSPNNKPVMYTVWASHAASITWSNYKSINPYDHFAALKIIEDNWRFAYLTSNDATATNMAGFFH